MMRSRKDAATRQPEAPLHDLVPRRASRVANPYWGAVQALPCRLVDGGAPELVNQHDGTRSRLVEEFGHAVPSPGDLAWLLERLAGRGVVEIGAGRGYWAWMLRQHGLDVAAFDIAAQPRTFAPVMRCRDEQVACMYPDRALMLCWPSYRDGWAARALDAYARAGGDLLVYVGEVGDRSCADAAFWAALNAWDLVGESPHHVTWTGTDCRLRIYRRRSR